MKHLLIAALLLVSFNINSAYSDAKNGKIINSEQLKFLIHIDKELTDHKLLYLIDSRSAKNYDEGHIPTAINIPVTETDSKTLKAAIPSNVDDKIIVFYCGSIKCPASAMAAKIAKYEGYDNIYKYKAGTKGWKNKGYKLIK